MFIVFCISTLFIPPIAAFIIFVAEKLRGKRMRDLCFVVNKQQLLKKQSCNFNNIIAGTVNYLRCVFTFDADWSGFKKVAEFKIENGKSYPVLIKSNQCMVPEEVTKEEKFFVIIHGKKDNQRIITNSLKISQGEDDD